MLTLKVAALVCAMATLAHAATQLKPTATGDSQSAQLSFATPKEAADALIKAHQNMTPPLSCRFLDRTATRLFLQPTPFATRTPPPHLLGKLTKRRR